MIITNLFTYYLVPKEEKVKYSKEASMNFVYRKGYKRFVEFVVSEDVFGYIDMEQLEDQVTDFKMTLEDFMLTIDVADVTVLTELPALKRYLRYVSLDNGGYTMSKVILSRREEDLDGTADILIGKQKYDMRALADRTLAVLNGLVHRTLNSPTGNQLLALDAEYVLQTKNYSSGLLYTDNGNRMVTVGADRDECIIEDGILKLKMHNKEFITESIAFNWTPKLVFLGQLAFDIDLTWDETEGVFTCSMDDLNTREILDKLGHIIYPRVKKIDQELTDGIYDYMLEMVAGMWLNFIVLIDSTEVEVIDVPMITQSCNGKYKIKGRPNYPMVDSKKVMFDYDADHYMPQDQTTITPRVEGIESQSRTRLPTEVSSLGNLITGSMGNHIAFRCISFNAS